ncbi:MAG: glycosyltransferase family 4 protein [Cytophagales bacterium]|nr:glycosyltransferase family 4 protein [Cytophagales bacterium]
MKKVILSVTNDISTDQRVKKISFTLQNFGFNVFIVGRKRKDSLPINKYPFKTKRLSLIFEKGPFFYAEYNIRLFFFLLFYKADILVSNDLDTLLPNYLISRLKRKVLVYDSHELFTEVVDLEDRKFIKMLWETIERWIFPRLQHCITVSNSIADFYNNKYNVKVEVVRNVPLLQIPDPDGIPELRAKPLFNPPKGEKEDEKIVVYHGVIKKGRGIEYILRAMTYLEGVVFAVLGKGNLLEEMIQLSKKLKVDHKVKFFGFIPLEKLVGYTKQADLGLCMGEDLGLSHHYSLPNKLFDYIHAGVPVLATPLVEIKKIINKYNIGQLIESHDPKHIADKINYMLANEERIKTWKKNLKIAAKELCWENEEKELLKVYKSLI